MKKKAQLLFILFLFSSLLSHGQQEWPQFRGFEGMGLSHGQANSYPAELTKLAWEVEINEGLSSPVVWEESIFITAHRQDTFLISCYHLESGLLLWQKQEIADTLQRNHPISSPAAPSVATNGEVVVAYFGSIGLMAFTMEGEELWKRTLPLEGNMYGVSVSPIFLNGKLVFSRDSDALSYIELIEPKTGVTLWRTDRPNYRGNWSTPGFCTVNGRDQILVYGVFSLKAYDFETGEECWVLPKLTDEPATTPLYKHGLVYVTTYNMKTNPEVLGLPTYDSLLLLYDADKNDSLSFEEIKGNKSILSRYDADGEGDHPLPGFFRGLDRDKNGQMSKEEWGRIEKWIDSFDWRNALIALKPPQEKGGLPTLVWEHESGVPECPSPLLVGERIYMIKNGGIFSCLNALTGELLYQEKLPAGGPYYASPVYADGKIYLVSTRGIVSIIEEGEEFKLLSQNDQNDRIMATPALVDGQIILRTSNRLKVYQ